eukprot:CAMPEP_0197439436 /NCGR_PEP_ID=MMETSP1175-20131217/6186_1 /TAXON_ID=1003142 /ORGANISM="Triceratium dubium, Strain CCMP147" /LENGTH=32 /DNA_ID= /DNA_START= /DNA_END= /DNA_ORIENTATION=
MGSSRELASSQDPHWYTALYDPKEGMVLLKAL